VNKHGWVFGAPLLTETVRGYRGWFLLLKSVANMIGWMGVAELSAPAVCLLQ
jgi:hypothetical protein